MGLKQHTGLFLHNGVFGRTGVPKKWSTLVLKWSGLTLWMWTQLLILHLRRLELQPATYKLCDLEQITALSGLQFSHLRNEVIIPALATSENSCEGQVG